MPSKKIVSHPNLPEVFKLQLADPRIDPIHFKSRVISKANHVGTQPILLKYCHLILRKSLRSLFHISSFLYEIPVVW